MAESLPRAMQLHVTAVNSPLAFNKSFAASPLPDLWPGLWHRYLDFIYASRDLWDPSVPKATLAHHDWWTEDARVEMQTGNDNAAHLVMLKEQGPETLP